jgi:hypothetical protein
LNKRLPYTNDEWDRCTPSDKKEKHSAFPACQDKKLKGHSDHLTWRRTPAKKVVVKQEEGSNPESNPDHTFSHNPYSTPPRLPSSTVPLFSQSEARASTNCRSRTRLVVNNKRQKLLLCFPVVWSFTLGTKLKPPTAQCFQETRPSFSVSRHPGIPSILTVFATLTTNEIHEQRILYRVPFSFAPVAARRTLKILRLNVC